MRVVFFVLKDRVVLVALSDDKCLSISILSFAKLFLVVVDVSAMLQRILESLEEIWMVQCCCEHEGLGQRWHSFQESAILVMNL